MQVQVRGGVRCGPGVGRGDEVLHPREPAPPADVVDVERHDGPSYVGLREIGAGPAPQADEDLDQRVLHQVLSGGDVSGQQEGEAHQGIAATLHEAADESIG